MRKWIILLVGVLAVLALGCDRRDNDWDTFEPDLKQVAVVTDTLRIGEGSAAATFAVSLGMVPADTVVVHVFSNNDQVVLTPDILTFVPVDDSWAEPRNISVAAVDDAIREGDHDDFVTILSQSPDASYTNQTGSGAVPVLIADNDTIGIVISESSLTLVESEAGIVRETYRVHMTSEPVSEVTVQTTVVPAEPSLHVEPEFLTFDATNWNQNQEIVLWIELDEIDNDDLVVTIEHDATSDDPNYGPELEIPSLVVTTYDFTLPPIARLHLVSGGILFENDPAAVVEVQVVLDRPSMENVRVHLGSVDGTAAGGIDFVTHSQELIFYPGQPLTQLSTVVVLDDAEIEPTEHLEMLITPLEHVIIGEDDRVTLSVVDNDLTPLTLSVNNVNEDDGAANFVVSIPFAETVPISFTFSTADGTAIAGEDYVALNQTFVLEPGVTQRTIPVVLNADVFYEVDETFTAGLSAISDNAVWNDPPTECTILNDELQAITFDDVVFNENDGNAIFRIEMLNPFIDAMNLTVSTRNGDGLNPAGSQVDAIGGFDFTSVTDQAWTIAANTTSSEFLVPITGDIDAESLHEYFQLEITAADHSIFTGSVATCTLVDDDQPCLLVSDVAAVESDGTVVFSIELRDESLNPVTSSADVTVLVETADQTAEADMDYTPVSHVFTIMAGQGTLSVPVILLDDIHDDDNETFVLTLSEMTNAGGSCGTDDAFCTLADNEFPSLNLQAAVTTLNEGSVWEFTVLLTTPRQEETTYYLDLLAGTSQGSGVDYTFSGLGTHTIAAMATEVSFTVPFLDDQLADEVDEIIRANISNANVALGVVDLEATIVDAPELSIGSASADEGQTAIFDVFLDAPSTADVQFNLQFADDTATMGADFNIAATGPYTFLAGEVATTVPVEIYGGDGGDAATEIFVITVVIPTNATVSADNSGLGTITDMDPPILSLAGDATGLEGENVEFVVDMSWSSEVDIMFNVDFIDGTAVRAGIDYDDSFAGPYVIPALATSFTIAVPAIADGGPEWTLEDFNIMLNTPVNAVLGMPISATGYVQDADQPMLTIPMGAIATEGDDLQFTVHLSEQTIVPVFFRLEYDQGSTNGASDFVAPSTALLSMMPGTVDTTITISTVEDLVHENQEAFILQLAANPNNAILGTPHENNGVINDDD